jgi:hypothetical protein
MAVTKKFNLTPTRIKALRLVKDRPGGVYVRLLAQELLTSEYRQRVGSGFAAQQATRSGAGYAVPLIKAGLLNKHATTYGWGRVSITEAGLKVLSDIDAQESGLDAVLERCIDVRNGGEQGAT